MWLVGCLTGPALALEQSTSPDSDRWLKHPALQPFRLSGEQLPPNVFLVRTKGHLPEADGVVVHGTHRGVFLVSGDPTVIRSLAEHGCAVMAVRDLPESPPPAARAWNWIDAPNPAIAAMVDQVRWEGVRDKIRWLVDFGTRYSFAPNHRSIAESIADVFDSYGLPTTLHAFASGGWTMWNVEAIQTGTVHPDSYVIICGHFDS
ncbi:MAG: hypothetical protein OEO21_07000, partial [Candidatus Krumholzibacteria bacterium]|nr:hypothetical protein [Candidatus Krumholzibacteria bacterium]